MLRDRPSEGGDERKVRQRLSALDEANTCLARYITGEPAERKDRWTVDFDLEQARAGVTPEVIYGVSLSIKKVQRDGLRTGTVLDLCTGWNLTPASDRRKLCATLEVEDPKVVIGSAMVPTMQQLEDFRQDPAKTKLILKEAEDHLIFMAEVYKWQAKEGKRFVHEMPAKSVA